MRHLIGFAFIMHPALDMRDLLNSGESVFVWQGVPPESKGKIGTARRMATLPSTRLCSVQSMELRSILSKDQGQDQWLQSKDI